MIIPTILVLSSDISGQVAKKIENKPIIELKNFIYAEVDKDGTNKVVSGSLGYHFAQRESVFDMNFSQNTKGVIQTLRAKTADKQNGILGFTGNIVCNNGNGTTLVTNNAKYNETTKVLNLTTNFVVQNEKYTIFGDSGTVSNNGRKVDANTIKAKMQTDKNNAAK